MLSWLSVTIEDTFLVIYKYICNGHSLNCRDAKIPMNVHNIYYTAEET